METAARTDVVIVGGGIAGGSLATVLAREGLDVVVLERDTAYRDRNKGECMVPWGWADAHHLGLTETLVTAGGFPNPSWVVTDPDGRRQQVPVSLFHESAPGTFSMPHVASRSGLADAATAAGADLRFGATHIAVEHGTAPQVSWDESGATQRVTARLVVGADGRGSRIRRQLGLSLQRTERTHMISSLLVEDTRGLGADLELANGHGRMLLVLPVGDRTARLYLITHKERFAGVKDCRRMLDACRLPAAEDPGRWADATPVGLCVTYGGEDAWVDVPVAPGAVLVGDAGGYNSPLIGQGLSLAMRDVRLVAELLLGAAEWTPELFAPYVAERAERLRRVRFAAQLWAELRLRPDEEVLRIRDHPTVTQMLPGFFTGFDAYPAALFSAATATELLAVATRDVVPSLGGVFDAPSTAAAP